MESTLAAQRPASRDRRFYTGMAIALALTVLFGFGRTYYFKPIIGGPLKTFGGGPITPLFHLHAALFTGWVLLFLVQTSLIATRRVAVHRRLGIAGVVLAAAMVVVGVTAAVAGARRGSAPPGADPLAFMAIPFFDMVVFSALVTAAFLKRKDREWHKRLMLLAYISLITAAIARLPGVIALGPPVFFGLSFLFVVAGIVYDVISRRRVHPAYLWGGGWILLSVPLRLIVSTTAAWIAFARWATS
jgi:uncharacterized membrane protein YozB (DUF420 family)